MNGRNTEQVDQNYGIRDDSKAPGYNENAAVRQGAKGKHRKEAEKERSHTKPAKISKTAKTAKTAKTDKTAKVARIPPAYLQEVNAVSSGNKRASGKTAKRKPSRDASSSLVRSAIQKRVSEHSELAMRAAKRIKASKNKRKTSHLVCHHLCMMLNSPISSSTPSFRPIARSRRIDAVNDSMEQCFLPI